MSSKSRKAFGLIVLFICTVFMLIFIYGLIRVSLQEGASSVEFTEKIITRIVSTAFDEELSASQLEALNLFLRGMAHFVLFAFLSFGLCVVAFLIFSRPLGRCVGLIISMVVCTVLSYYTEYYKQFVAGRHFQIEDMWLNLYGVALGLCSFLVTDFIFRGINARSRKHR